MARGTQAGCIPREHDHKLGFAENFLQALQGMNELRPRSSGIPGELYPAVGLIVSNMTRPTERVVAFHNQRGTAEQPINEGKNPLKWTRLSCCWFAANAVRLQLHALAPISPTSGGRWLCPRPSSSGR